MILTVEGHPPTSNKLWGKRKGGKGRFLTKEAKDFQAKLKEAAAEQLTPEDFQALQDLANAGSMFHFTVILGFKSLKTKTTGRYKRIDASNRIKWCEDCLAKVLDVDDSLNQGVSAWKCEDPEGERTYIIYEALEDEVELGQVQRHRTGGLVQEARLDRGPSRAYEEHAGGDAGDGGGPPGTHAAERAQTQDDEGDRAVWSPDQDPASVRHELPRLSGRPDRGLLESQLKPLQEEGPTMTITIDQINETPDDKLRPLLMNKTNLGIIGSSPKDVVNLATDDLKQLYFDSLGDAGEEEEAPKKASKKKAAAKKNGTSKKKAAAATETDSSDLQAGVDAIAGTVAELDKKTDSMSEDIDSIGTQLAEVKKGIHALYCMIVGPAESFDEITDLVSDDDPEDD